jgi:hypothetical protein
METVEKLYTSYATRRDGKVQPEEYIECFLLATFLALSGTICSPGASIVASNRNFQNCHLRVLRMEEIMNIEKLWSRTPNGVARALAFVTGFTAPAIAMADFQPDLQTVPEPETLALLGVGAVAMFVARWMRRR